MPELMLRGQEIGESMNLIPLLTLSDADIKTSFLNILLFIPFGFGLPFVTNLRMKKVVIAGALFSIIIELLQFLTGFISKVAFCIADANDVIFNTIGIVLGYILFVGFVRIFRRLLGNSKISVNPVLQYIAKRPQVDK